MTQPIEKDASRPAETKLVVFTVIVRAPKDMTTWGDVYAVETKHNYFGDIESPTAFRRSPSMAELTDDFALGTR